MTNGSRYEPESLPEITVAELSARDLERERERLARDDGEYVDPETGRLSTRELRSKERSRACWERLPDGGWCVLPSAHKDASTSVWPVPCRGVRARYQPLPPPPDRRLMSAFRLEISEKYDDKKRARAWTDRFGVVAPQNMSPSEWWVMRCEGRR
jgi:hypothetical protein